MCWYLTAFEICHFHNSTGQAEFHIRIAAPDYVNSQCCVQGLIAVWSPKLVSIYSWFFFYHSYIAVIFWFLWNDKRFVKQSSVYLIWSSYSFVRKKTMTTYIFEQSIRQPVKKTQNECFTNLYNIYYRFFNNSFEKCKHTHAKYKTQILDERNYVHENPFVWYFRRQHSR